MADVAGRREAPFRARAARFQQRATEFGGLWLIAPPFAVAIVFQYLLARVLNASPTGPSKAWDMVETAAAGHAAGVAVATTFALYVVACVAAVIAAYIQTREVHPTIAIDIPLLYTGVLILAFGVIFYIGGSLIGDLGQPSFEDTVGGIGLFPLLNGAITASGILSAIVTVAISLSVVSLSTPNKISVDPAQLNRDPGDASKLDVASQKILNNAAHHLGRRISRFKSLTIAAAAVLFTGVAFLKTWADWPLAFWTMPATSTEHPMLTKSEVALKNLINSYTAVDNAIVSYQSAYFTLLLLAVVAPLAFAFASHGRKLAALDPKNVDDPDTCGKFMDKFGLKLTTSEQIQRILLVVSPLLAAPISKLLGDILTSMKG